MMQADFYSDSDDVLEKVIHKISPDPSSHYKLECPCGCHSLAECSEKSFVIVPFRQNGSVIDVLKLPIFKIKRQPQKKLLGYAKCKMVPFGRKGSEHHFPFPMWSVQQSDLAACLTCKEGQRERQHDMLEGKYYRQQERPHDRLEEKHYRQGDKQDMQVKSDVSSQTEAIIMREKSMITKSTSQVQNAGPSTSFRHSSVKESVPEEPEEEVGRYSYEDYRTGFGQWYPFFVNKPSKRWRKE